MRRPAVLLVGLVLAVPGCGLSDPGPAGGADASGVHVLEIGPAYDDVPDLLVPLDDGTVLLSSGGAGPHRVSVVDPGAGEVVGTAETETGRPVAVATDGNRGYLLTVATDFSDRLAVQEIALPSAQPGPVHDLDAQPQDYIWQNVRAVADDGGFTVLVLADTGPPRLLDVALDGRVRGGRVLDLGFPGATFLHGELARGADGGHVVVVGVIPADAPDGAYARAWLVRTSAELAVVGRPVELAPGEPFSSAEVSGGPDVVVGDDGTAVLLLRAGPEPTADSTRARLVTVDAGGTVRTLPTADDRDLDALAVGDDSGVLLVSRAVPDDAGDDVRVSAVDPDGGDTLAQHALCDGQGYGSRVAAEGSTVFVSGACGTDGAAVLWTVR